MIGPVGAILFLFWEYTRMSILFYYIQNLINFTMYIYKETIYN
jgi:hypothetical protein